MYPPLGFWSKGERETLEPKTENKNAHIYQIPADNPMTVNYHLIISLCFHFVVLFAAIHFGERMIRARLRQIWKLPSRRIEAASQFKFKLTSPHSDFNTHTSKPSPCPVHSPITWRKTTSTPTQPQNDRRRSARRPKPPMPPTASSSPTMTLQIYATCLQRPAMTTNTTPP